MTDVLEWQSADIMIDGTTMLVGVAGWPVSHSRSPLIHNYWFEQLGLNAAYVPLAIAPETFEQAIRGLAASGFRGVNVTAPHKETAARSADMIDEAVRQIGAANTLRFTQGTIAATNTDSVGFLRALVEAAPEWRAGSGPAVILGAGGAARAVVHALLGAGVETIRIVNRSPERAHALAAQFERNFEIYNWDRVEQSFEDAALLVNTTTLGMQGHPPLEISLSALPLNAVVNDIINAPLETDLLQTAHRRGMVAVDGLGMLLYQAAAAFEYWFGIMPGVDEDLRAHVLSAP